jgi:hypothetical protein
MATEGRTEVLFLVRDRLCLSEGSNIFTLEFPANIVHDIDVADRDGLYNLVTAFVQNNKLLPAQLYVVLSESVCFSRDFPISAPADTAKVEADIKEFTDSIPFSSVVSKTYKTANTFRVVGANQELIDTIFNAFEAKGFGVSALVPANTFPDFGVGSDLTIDKAQSVLGKKELAVSASMVGERMVKEQQLATSQTAVPKNKILPYLVVVFAVLIIILVVVLIIRK